MKNKLSKIILTLVLPCLLLVSGCKKDEEPEPVQITMLQIMDKISQMDEFEVDDKTIMYYGNALNRSEDLLTWQASFERQNIDTSEFMSMEKIRYYYMGNSGTSIYMHVYMFKFSNSDAASNCYNKYKVSEGYIMKEYGNVLVMVDELIADVMFEAIDNLA